VIEMTYSINSKTFRDCDQNKAVKGVLHEIISKFVYNAVHQNRGI